MSTGKTKASEGGVHRLNNILVEEVSVVDRAANKRRFLLVKREDVEMTELRPNGRGGLTKVPVAKADDDEPKDKDTDESDTAQKAGKPFPGAAKPFGSKPAPAADDDDDDDDESEDGKDPKKKKPKPDGLKKEGPSLLDELTGCAEQLVGIIGALRTPAATTEAAPAAAAGAAKAIEGLGEVHKRLGALLGAETNPTDGVAKAGRKMSKERLSVFSGAMDMLGKLLTELMAGTPDGTEDPALKVAAAKRASGEADRSAQLAKAMTELVAITKAQQREIDTLKKGGVVSNSIPVEKGARQRDEDEVSWPLDMNRPFPSDDD